MKRLTARHKARLTALAMGEKTQVSEMRIYAITTPYYRAIVPSTIIRSVNDQQVADWFKASRRSRIATSGKRSRLRPEHNIPRTPDAAQGDMPAEHGRLPDPAKSEWGVYVVTSRHEQAGIGQNTGERPKTGRKA